MTKRGDEPALVMIAAIDSWQQWRRGGLHSCAVGTPYRLQHALSGRNWARHISTVREAAQGTTPIKSSEPSPTPHR